MIPPLSTLSLITLRDNISTMTYPNLDLIPPTDHRQMLLNLVLMSGSIDQKAARSNLSSPTFLRGFRSLNTQAGHKDDSQYLDLVAKSLAQMDSNGRTVGSGIAELHLNLYGLITKRVSESGYGSYEISNLASIIRIIEKCPILKSLNLKLVMGHHRTADGYFCNEVQTGFNDMLILSPLSEGGLLNRLSASAPCSSVLEQVESMAFTGIPTVVTPNGPVGKFRSLVSLHLTSCSVEVTSWKQFLRSVEGTLVELTMDYVAILGAKLHDTSIILPDPLPNLKRFTCVNRLHTNTNLPVSTLFECPKLEWVRLQLLGDDSDECVHMIGRLNAVVELVLMVCGLDDDTAITSLMVLDLVREKVKELIFDMDQPAPWYLNVLVRAFSVCTDLTSLHFHTLDSNWPLHNETMAELMLANLSLAPLFKNPERVRKLRQLSLIGEIDPEALTSLFGNGAALKTLSIRQCPQLSDEHLLLWASCGGRPSKLRLIECTAISDRGLMSVLEGSGDDLTGFVVDPATVDRITYSTWHKLADNCRYLEMFNAPDPLVRDVFLRKCFRKNYRMLRIGTQGVGFSLM